MSEVMRPNTTNLNDCGCCEGITAETPLRIDNRPGLAALAYRIGQQPSFKQSMLASLSVTPNERLRTLATREDDDFGVALIDAWSTTLDVLTFYQERLANESYLRTATERASLLYLARTIGYELRPGVAATTALAFTLEDAPGAPPEATIDIGVKAQSVPGPGEQAQVFETVEQIVGRAAWNAIRPRQTAPQALSADMTTLWLAGTDANLKPGDPLLVVAPGGSGMAQALRRVGAVAKDEDNKCTGLTLEPPDDSPVTAGSNLAPGVWALRVRAAPFGHNAPKKAIRDASGNITDYEEWDLNEPDTNLIALDAVYDQVTQGSWAVIDRPNSVWFADSGVLFSGVRAVPSLLGGVSLNSGLSFDTGALSQLATGPLVDIVFGRRRRRVFAHVTAARATSRADYGIAARVTQLTLDQDWQVNDLDFAIVRETVIYTQSEQLTPGEAPLGEALPRNAIALSGDYSALAKGRLIVVSGQLAGSASDSPTVSEVATIDGVTTSGGRTTLALLRDLANSYRRSTVTINANVARATHGETVGEVLGSGGSQPYQRFTLRQAPLTYLSASTPSGADSTLEVRANGVLWHEVPTLYGRRANERVYITRASDDGKTTVQFGDGRSGARLPSGSDNVRAVYRKGSGAAGNVKAGQISLLMSRPLGVRAVVNPEAPTGGVDAEQRDGARRNAPLTTLTLDRIVSLQDYEDFARAFRGVGKALATWTWDGQTRGVFVTVAGVGGAPLSASSATYGNLLAAMRAAGDPYVPLRVQSYLARAFRIDALVTKDPDYTADQVAQGVRLALLDAFSFDAREFGQPVALSEIMAVIQSVPGVVAVDINALGRSDGVGGDGLKNRLPAARPQLGDGASVAPAELLTLDPNAIEIAVQA
jgi:hypothetical protein